MSVGSLTTLSLMYFSVPLMTQDIIQVEQVDSRTIVVTTENVHGHTCSTQHFKTRQKCTDAMDEYTASGYFIYTRPVI